MHNARFNHTATLLPNGQVLVTGGSTYEGNGTRVLTTELYDQEKGTWTFTGSLHDGRENSTATLLPDGKVLVIGGYSGDPNYTCMAPTELYDQEKGTWMSTGSMQSARCSHTTTLLPDGSLLIAGGSGGYNDFAPTELSSPSSR